MLDLECPAKLRLSNSNKVALVSSCDLLRCQKHEWNLNPNGYAQTTINGETIFLHRFIFNLKKGDGILVDHKNHNPLDCTRNEVRVCTRSQNNFNKKKFKGLTRCKQTGYWRVRIMKDRKEVFHKRCASKTTALTWLRSMSKFFFGEFANV